MNKSNSSLFLILAVTLSLVGAQVGKADDKVQWLVENARAQGTGCTNDPARGNADTYFLENGGDLSVVFSNLALNLVAGDNGPLLQRRSCSIAVPFLLQPNFLPLSFTQTLTYGILKTEGASATIESNGVIFGGKIKKFSKKFARGARADKPLEIQTTHETFDKDRRRLLRHLCRRPQASRNQYAAEVAIEGARDSRQQSLMVSADSLDLRLDVASRFSLCGVDE